MVESSRRFVSSRTTPSGRARQRGRFIVLDGPDGGGKSTQATLLCEALSEEGRPVELTREPGGTPVADAIRELLLDPANSAMSPSTELLLYAAARAQHVDERIRPALEADKVVLCDRFADSTTASSSDCATSLAIGGSST